MMDDQIADPWRLGSMTGRTASLRKE